MGVEGHFIIAVLGGLPAAIAALISLVAVLRNKGKINDIHVSINSRVDQLLAAQIAIARQAGIDEEIARQIEQTARASRR